VTNYDANFWRKLHLADCKAMMPDSFSFFLSFFLSFWA
jgi:hypothetical protein